MKIDNRNIKNGILKYVKNKDLMNKTTPETSSIAPFKILKTRIVLTIDLPKELIVGYVDHYLSEIKTNRVFNFHCGEQIHVTEIKLIESESKKSVNIQKVRTNVFANLESKDVEKENFCIDDFVSRTLTREEIIEDRGSLMILFDDKVENFKMDKNYIIRIYYNVKSPRCGIFFFKNNNNEHFMYTDNSIKGSRLWFPCIDNANIFSQYFFEITTSSSLFVICCGNLKGQYQNSSGTLKTAFFEQLKPITPHSVCIVIGPFEVYPKSLKNSSFSSISQSFFTFYPRNKFNEYQIRRTTKIMENVILFIENFLKIDFKKDIFDNYNIVFLEETYRKSSSFSCMSILSSDFIMKEDVIEGCDETWFELAFLFCRQIFGNYMVKKNWTDTWLPLGFSGWMAYLFRQNVFGKNELHFFIKEEIEKLKKLEKHNFPLCYKVLSSSSSSSSSRKSRKRKSGIINLGTKLTDGEDPSQTDYLLRAEELLNEYVMIKAPLVIMMIGKHVRKENLQDILQQYVKSARDMNFREIHTKRFIEKLKRFENFDVRNFANFWIYGTGLLELECGFEYDYQRNMVKIGIKQVLPFPDQNIFRGSLDIVFHETSGANKYSMQIEREYSYNEYSCSTQGVKKQVRRKKRGGEKIEVKKIEEPVLKIGKSNVVSPLQWIRFDQDFKLLHIIHLPQPIYMLLNQLNGGKDVFSLVDAIDELVRKFPQSSKVVQSLISVVSSPMRYHKVRIHALKGLIKITLKHLNMSQTVSSRLLLYFKEKHFTKENTLKPNDFTKIDEYHLKKEIPYYLSFIIVEKGLFTEKKRAKMIDEEVEEEGEDENDSQSKKKNRRVKKYFESPSAIVDLLWSLLKYNDSIEENLYTDVYYLARLLQGLGNLTMNNASKRSEILDFIKRKLVIDSLIPSYNHVMTKCALKALKNFYLNKENIRRGMNNLDFSFFIERLEDKFPLDVRIVSLKCLMKLFSSSRIKLRNIIVLKNEVSCNINIPPPKRRDERPPKIFDIQGNEKITFYDFFNYVMKNFVCERTQNPYVRFEFVKLMVNSIQMNLYRILNASNSGKKLRCTLITDFLVLLKSKKIPENRNIATKLWMLIRNERIDQRFRIAILDLFSLLFGYSSTPKCMRKNGTKMEIVETPKFKKFKGRRVNLTKKMKSSLFSSIYIPPPLYEVPKDGEIRIMATPTPSGEKPFNLFSLSPTTPLEDQMKNHNQWSAEPPVVNLSSESTGFGFPHSQTPREEKPIIRGEKEEEKIDGGGKKRKFREETKTNGLYIEKDEEIKQPKKKRKVQTQISRKAPKASNMKRNYDGDTTVDRSCYVEDVSGNEDSVLQYMKNLQMESSFLNLLKYENDFEDVYKEQDHLMCIELKFPLQNAINVKLKDFSSKFIVVQMYINPKKYSTTSNVTASEIYQCLPLDSDEVDSGNKEKNGGEIINLEGNGQRGLSWFKLDGRKVGDISYGRTTRREVLKKEKEIGLWRKGNLQSNKFEQYCVVGYGETNFYNDDYGGQYSNRGYSNYKYSTCWFSSPLNILGGIVEFYKPFVNEDLFNQYYGGIVNCYRLRRIVFGVFIEGKHYSNLEVDLYPGNEAAQFFLENLKKANRIKSTVVWYDYPLYVRYFSFDTKNVEENERFKIKMRELSQNKPYCTNKLRNNEIAYDFHAGCVYMSSPTVKEKENRNPLVYNLAVLGQVVSVKENKRFWEEKSIKRKDKPNEIYINTDISVFERIIIMKLKRCRDDGENEKVDVTVEFMIELYSSATADLIYSSLPLTTRIKKYSNNESRFCLGQLDSNFCRQIPVEPNISMKKFKKDEFTFWKNGESLIFCEETGELPFSCNVWGIYRGKLNKPHLEWGEFEENDVIEFRKYKGDLR